MIFDDLVNTTNSMQEIQIRVRQRNDALSQEATDKKYRELLELVNNFIVTIEYLYSLPSIQKNTDILASISELLISLERAVESGFAYPDIVLKSENFYKSIQTNMKKEWPKQYAELTSSTISTLEAIRGIASENVTNCLSRIRTAESWITDVQTYKSMNIGLQEAGKLINSLGLDDVIIKFLQNTNAGRATLKDLNDEVIAWIRNEDLENKIRISFAK